jgi:hypothetical protein
MLLFVSLTIVLLIPLSGWFTLAYLIFGLATRVNLLPFHDIIQVCDEIIFWSTEDLGCFFLTILVYCCPGPFIILLHSLPLDWHVFVFILIYLLQQGNQKAGWKNECSSKSMWLSLGNLLPEESKALGTFCLFIWRKNMLKWTSGPSALLLVFFFLKT